MFVLELLQPPQLRDLHARILLLPVLVGWLGDSVFAAGLRNLRAGLTPLRIRTICPSENFDVFT